MARGFANRMAANILPLRNFSSISWSAGNESGFGVNFEVLLAQAKSGSDADFTLRRILFPETQLRRCEACGSLRRMYPSIEEIRDALLQRGPA